MRSEMKSEIFLSWLVACSVTAFLMGYVHATVTERTVSRHAIQRVFLKTRAEAEKILAEQREQE